MHKRERVFSILAILGSLLGAVGLLFLSIFDIRRHSRAHHAFLIVFIVGVALSAIFSIIEVLFMLLFYHPEFTWALSTVGSARAFLATSI
jgi:uncharacterized membrane protein